MEVLEKRLIEAISLEVHPEVSEEVKNYSYGRLNIDPDIESGNRSDIKNMLVRSETYFIPI